MSDAPRRIALVGPMGVGKSAVGTALAARTGRRLVDTDARVEAAAGVPVAALFATEGEASFRRREHDALVEALDHDAPVVVATGGGAVTDERSRRLLRERATVVWLTAPAEVLAVRIGDVSTRPLLARGEPVDVLRELLAARHAHYEGVADLCIDTTTGGPDDLADAICAALGVSA